MHVSTYNGNFKSSIQIRKTHLTFRKQSQNILSLPSFNVLDASCARVAHSASGHHTQNAGYVHSRDEAACTRPRLSRNDFSV